MIDPRIKTALVTGSAKRNGRAIAEWLAGQGVKVAIHYQHSKKEAAEVAKQRAAANLGEMRAQHPPVRAGGVDGVDRDDPLAALRGSACALIPLSHGCSVPP